MADWSPLYGVWHNFDRQTGIGTPDTPIDADAAANWDAGIAAALAAAGSVVTYTVASDGTPQLVIA